MVIESGMAVINAWTKEARGFNDGDVATLVDGRYQFKEPVRPPDNWIRFKGWLAGTGVISLIRPGLQNTGLGSLLKPLREAQEYLLTFNAQQIDTREILIGLREHLIAGVHSEHVADWALEGIDQSKPLTARQLKDVYSRVRGQLERNEQAVQCVLDAAGRGYMRSPVHELYAMICGGESTEGFGPWPKDFVRALIQGACREKELNSTLSETQVLEAAADVFLLLRELSVFDKVAIEKGQRKISDKIGEMLAGTPRPSMEEIITHVYLQTNSAALLDSFIEIPPVSQQYVCDLSDLAQRKQEEYFREIYDKAQKEFSQDVLGSGDADDRRQLAEVIPSKSDVIAKAQFLLHAFSDIERKFLNERFSVVMERTITEKFNQGDFTPLNRAEFSAVVDNVFQAFEKIHGALASGEASEIVVNALFQNSLSQSFDRDVHINLRISKESISHEQQVENKCKFEARKAAQLVQRQEQEAKGLKISKEREREIVQIDQNVKFIEKSISFRLLRENNQPILDDLVRRVSQPGIDKGTSPPAKDLPAEDYAFLKHCVISELKKSEEFKKDALSRDDLGPPTTEALKLLQMMYALPAKDMQECRRLASEEGKSVIEIRDFVIGKRPEAVLPTSSTSVHVEFQPRETVTSDSLVAPKTNSFSETAHEVAVTSIALPHAAALQTTPESTLIIQAGLDCISSRTITQVLNQPAWESDLNGAMRKAIPQIFPSLGDRVKGFLLGSKDAVWYTLLNREQKDFVQVCTRKRCQAFGRAYHSGELSPKAVVDAAKEVFALLGTIVNAPGLSDAERLRCYSLATAAESQDASFAQITMKVSAQLRSMINK